MKPEVILITGGSSGIGAALASHLAALGHTVYGLSRSGKAPAGVHPLTADVSSPAAIEAARDEILAAEGRLDILVLAAGCGIAGALECLPPEEVALQMGVNVMGVDHTLRAMTPALRESRGRVLVIGSVAGIFPIPFQAHYSASKAAVESLLRAYAGEVRPFGISVGVALLGDTATGFTAARRLCRDGDALYGGRILHSVAKMERDEEGGASPEAVARALARRLLAGRMPRRFTVGESYRLLVLLSRLLPISWQDAIVSRLYR